MTWPKLKNQLVLLRGDKLKPCPFCGSEELELASTHTASYWIECGCGAEVHGDYGGDEGNLPQHMFAKQSAIESWNARA